MTERPVDYARLYHERQRHHARYVRYVEAHGLTCQACGGMGGDYYTAWSEPPEPCGWCETTGKVTRWVRGAYLRYMRKRKRRHGMRRVERAA